MISLMRSGWGSWDCLARRRLRDDLITLYNNLKGVPPSSPRQLVARRVDSLKFQQERFNLDRTRNFSTEREIRCWNGLPREADSPPLEVLEKRLNVALGSVKAWTH